MKHNKQWNKLVYPKTGFPSYMENWENLKFCHLLFQAWNLLKKWGGGGGGEFLPKNLGFFLNFFF